nr:DUF6188 family protein [Streptomyces bikiniensis]
MGRGSLSALGPGAPSSTAGSPGSSPTDRGSSPPDLTPWAGPPAAPRCCWSATALPSDTRGTDPGTAPPLAAPGLPLCHSTDNCQQDRQSCCAALPDHRRSRVRRRCDGTRLGIGPDPRHESWHLTGSGSDPVLVGPGGEAACRHRLPPQNRCGTFHLRGDGLGRRPARVGVAAAARWRTGHGLPATARNPDGARALDMASAIRSRAAALRSEHASVTRTPSYSRDSRSRVPGTPPVAGVRRLQAGADTRRDRR